MALGASDLSTTMLAGVYSGNMSNFISLFAIMIFYTSFILYGLHLQDLVGRTRRASAFTILAVLALYGLVWWFDIPFAIIVASAGFCVSAYAFLVGLTAIKALRPEKKAERAVAWNLLVFAVLPWLLFLVG